MKKVINEQQLVNIVSEATKRVLKEIGDTPAGRAMLRRASDKARFLGRGEQSEKFRDKADSETNAVYKRSPYTDEASTDYFTYYNDAEDLITVKRWGKVSITPHGGFNEDLGFIKDIAANPKALKRIKTSDRMTARKVAQWCDEFAPKDGAIPPEAYDWHFWAQQ